MHIILDNNEYIADISRYKRAIFSLFSSCKTTKNNVYLCYAMKKLYIEYLYDQFMQNDCNIDIGLMKPVRDDFRDFLMSEYKEIIYTSIFDDAFQNEHKYKIIDIERYLLENYTQDEIINHRYDPENPLNKYGQTGKATYAYYENVEKQGVDMLMFWTYTVHEDIIYHT